MQNAADAAPLRDAEAKLAALQQRLRDAQVGCAAPCNTTQYCTALHSTNVAPYFAIQYYTTSYSTTHGGLVGSMMALAAPFTTLDQPILCCITGMCCCTKHASCCWLRVRVCGCGASLSIHTHACISVPACLLCRLWLSSVLQRRRRCQPKHMHCRQPSKQQRRRERQTKENETARASRE